MEAERERTTPPRDESLCERCVHVRYVESSKGSRFLFCGRSRTEPHLPKYPPQPGAPVFGVRVMTVDPEQLRVPQASLLAAYPDMLDPNFMHSVLLMCEHTDEGAYGLMLNRPTELTLDELFPNHELLQLTDFPVHLGGPVDATRFQFLHTVPDEIQGGVPLTDRLYIGGELDELAGYLTRTGGSAPRSVRAFVGCSSWAPGQLEVELATGSWLPAPLEHDIVFDEGFESSWRRVLRSLGGPASGLENLPPDASWN